MTDLPRRLFTTVCTAALLLVVLSPSLVAQTSSASGPDCRNDATCPPASQQDHRRIGARLRLLRSIVRHSGVDALAVAPGGAPSGVTLDGVGALLRFRSRLGADERRRLDGAGVALARDNAGSLVRIGAVYLARVEWEALDDLRNHPKLVRAEATWSPSIELPLQETARDVGAAPLRRMPRFDLDGEGTVIGDIDSSFDIYHPHLFRADGGWYEWVDTNSNGEFDPGTDGVDLDDDGTVDDNEYLHVLDATVMKGGRRDNDDGELQPRRDWLYVDSSGDDERNVGPDKGFSEADPAYGEPVFVADDVDRDGTLAPVEKLVRLDSSKFTRIVESGRTYERGTDLIDVGKTAAEDRSYHGTAVASVLVGGQPPFHDRVGLAPRAELVGYSHATNNGGGRGQFGDMTQFVDEASDSDVDILLHEWTDIVSTPLDGSTNFEQTLDTAHSDGIVQVTPLGNMNLSKKHVERDVQAGDEPVLRIRVGPGFNRRGRTYPYRVMWSSFWWRGNHQPTFTLVSPSGDTVRLGGGQQSIGPHSVNASSDVSPRGTRQMIYSVWKRQDGLETGTWKVRVGDIEEPDRIVGRVVDRYSSWGVGIHWENPTQDRGTLTFPATADSAFGVAAFGGRHDMPGDGSGSAEGELRNYSGRGPRLGGGRAADIAAPDDPYAAFGISPQLADRGIGRSWFRRFGGTSGAGPHVAASFALLMQSNSSWAPDRLERRIAETADDSSLTPDYGAAPNRAWGHGKIDTYDAVADSDLPMEGGAPSARLDARPESDAVRLDASGSSDPDGDSLEYRYDFEYDGEWDTDWTSNATREAPYTEFSDADSAVAKIAVRDARGNRAGALDRFDLSPPMGDDAGDTGSPDVAGGPDAASSDVADGGPVVRKPDGDDEFRRTCFGCASGSFAPPVSWIFALFGVLAWRIRRRG